MLAEIGRPRPPFALNDQYGRNTTPLDDEFVGDPIVLVFDRHDAACGTEDSAELLRAVAGLHERLKDIVVAIFVMSQRPTEETTRLAKAENITFRLLADETGTVFESYGINLAEAPAEPACIVLDPNGRVVETFEKQGTAEQMQGVLACIQRLDERRPRGTLGMHPPVLVVPNAMDVGLCERLIETWHRPVPLLEGDGKTAVDPRIERGDLKVRNARYGHVVQYVLRDPDLSQEIDRRLMPRVAPEMEKAFGYRPAKREDYRIACYDAADGGSLPAHRDNPTETTKHRLFTVSVNLNNRFFEGGELAFRESSDHLYDVDEGTAIVWSCSLLHEVMPVTQGRRFILATHLYG